MNEFTLATWGNIAEIIGTRLAGGIVSVMCRKLRRWCEDLREEQQQPSFAEWLGDQAIKAKAESEPAHI